MQACNCIIGVSECTLLVRLLSLTTYTVWIQASTAEGQLQKDKNDQRCLPKKINHAHSPKHGPAPLVDMQAACCIT